MPSYEREDKRMKYYIAYGSNLNVEQMRRRCPKAVPVSIGSIKGWRLLFKGSKTGSYLTIEKSPDDPESRVPVVVFLITPENEMTLDRYEGYPSFYYKRLFNVKINGKKEIAFAYIMHEDRKIGIPSDEYVEVCREGYNDFGLNEEWLEKALRYSIDHYGDDLDTME